MLFNKAGVSFPTPLEEISRDEFRLSRALNRDAVDYASMEALPVMVENDGGVILSTTSGAGTGVCPDYESRSPGFAIGIREHGRKFEMDNSEQVEFWNGEAATGWVKDQEQMDRMLAALSAMALEVAKPARGERVIDIGCGCGTTTLEIGDTGAEVRGVDVSEPMLAHAKTRAGARKNVSFSCVDAATEPYASEHDLVFSRFGVMFFADPVAAFTNIRTALNGSGRMVFICWRPPAENQWISLPAMVMRKYMENPPPQDPTAPGPFAFADPERLRDILTKAGFEAITINPIDAAFPMAADLESGIVAQTTTGPMARMFSAIPDEKKEAAVNDLRSALAPFVSDDGLVFKAGAWLVSAKR